MLNFHFIISNVPHIPQQLQELICILFRGQLPQSQLMEFFNLIIIVPIREVLLLKILLELLPHNIPFTNLLHLLEVLPPYGCSSRQIQDGYPILHISKVVLDLEIFYHPKKPSFNFLTILYLTIKGSRLSLLEFIT